MKYLNTLCLFFIITLALVYAAESEASADSSVAAKMPAKRGIYGFGGYGHGFGSYYGYGGHGYYGGHSFGYPVYGYAVHATPFIGHGHFHGHGFYH